MKNVSAAIFLKNDFVLIAKRGNGKDLSGYWEFPGGKQEENETIFECLEREIVEEFNVECKANEMFFESIYHYDNDTIKLIAIFSNLLDNQIELKVHEDYKWVKINYLLEYNLAPADISIAKKLIEYYDMKKINLTSKDVITNNELVSIFHCSPQGGMKRSKKTNTLVIVSNHITSIYHDRWVGDNRWNGGILYYTGMGSVGDQSFDFMQNKTLCDSDSNGVRVYLFEVCVTTQYTFIGQVALAGKPFHEEQPDINNKMRHVCIFPLKVVANQTHFIDNEREIPVVSAVPVVAEYAKRCAKKISCRLCIWEETPC
jgi:5-methylcytosine-specific restriction protein A